MAFAAFNSAAFDKGRRVGWSRFVAAATAVTMGVTVCTAAAASVRSDPVAAAARQAPPPGPSTVSPAQRDTTLPAGWRTSSDLAWTTIGDASGLHLLVASARTGYTWRTAATLSEPGVDTDQWIGNACLTGSGKRAVVVYAPRTFTNEPVLFNRGGFTAIVDVESGTVTRLPITTSLAYFNPGCGIGETAVLTQGGDEDLGATRLTPVDARTGTMSSPVTVHGQLTSAVPAGEGIIAADGYRLVRVVGDDRLKPLANTANVPFDLRVDARGGIVYQDHVRDVVRVQRTAGTATATLATGSLSALNLVQGAGGRVFLTGAANLAAPLPRGVTKLDVPADAAVSTTGGLALTRVLGDNYARRPAGATVDPATPRPVRIDARVVATRRSVLFTVEPSVRVAARRAEGAAPTSPRASKPAVRSTASGSASSPVDDDRSCSVPRNDPRAQAYQPTPRQVEWAADEAVQNALTFTRPAGFKDFGLPAYSPQGWFPPFTLLGGGHVPAQILLGVLAQESNLWQASNHAESGELGNPLVGNFYGHALGHDFWEVDWGSADCGYGVAQVTDGMRLAGHEKPGETALPPDKQRAIALDYVTNIAAGLRILQDKWNQVWASNMLINDGDPARIEDWFFAVWAYNTGLHPNPGNGDPWGVGWLNNPVNPIYPPTREPFLDGTYADASHPQDWPYEEKVLGWAGHPIATLDGAGYRAAWWDSVADRTAVKPPVPEFCDDSNDCHPGLSFPPTDPKVSDQPAGPCAHKNSAGQYDLQCYYHEANAWKADCATTCGHELIRFDTTYPEQPDGTHFPPECTNAGLPAGAIVVDDVPSGTPSYRCAGAANGSGTFSLDFAQIDGLFTSKVDFHQLGGGYRGHFWFAHAIPCGHWSAPSYTCGSSANDFLRVTGTWTPPSSVQGWTRIEVHIPDHGAQTEQADYHIDLGGGPTRHRVVNQHWNKNTWVDLGTFDLRQGAAVHLSNQTPDGSADRDAQAADIAFDAVAFVPSTKPAVNYVAMGDSYSVGEGLQPFDANSDFNDPPQNDSCHRASRAYSRMVKLPGHTGTIEQEAAEGHADFHFLACSGAIATSITDDAIDGPGQNDGENTDWHGRDWHSGEIPQVDQGYLDTDTTLVTLSVGGNDVRFADVMRGCTAGVNGCDNAEFKLTHRGKVDPQPLFRYEPHVIQDLLPDKLEAVYLAVHDRAPNARIVVVGYPRLFHASNPSACKLAPVGTAVVMLNLWADQLDDVIGTTVADLRDLFGYDIRFVDPRDAFDGHGPCDGDNYVNGVTAPDSSGSGTHSPNGMGSFHPTTAGQSAYADLIESVLSSS
ncbi:MAG TPA: hypothetical protein VF069_17420 [Streptosporangiaceae bacterium]